jgi:hypothetical protein
LFPSEFQGFACAVFNMAGTISGTISTSVLGALLAKYDKGDEYPQNAGYIVGGCVIFSYLTCGPIFIWSGIEYKKELEIRK